MNPYAQFLLAFGGMTFLSLSGFGLLLFIMENGEELVEALKSKKK